MKLATLRDRTRDGRLLVVRRDLARAAPAAGISPTLQAALDAWESTAPRLERLAAALEAGTAPGEFDLDVARLAAPLPRAYAWIDSSVYLNHMELARRLRGATMPEAYRREPLMSLRMSAPFLAGHDDLALPPGDVGLDLEGEVAAIVDDVAARTPVERCGARIRLLTLVNDASLRTVFAREVAEGKTTYHGKIATAMAPIAATPDELGAAWDGARVALKLRCHVNATLIGQPDAGVDMAFGFPRIVAEACAYRPLPAGTVLAAGTVSNRDPAAGSACIAERRMLETLAHGKPQTPWLAAGDSLRIEMLDGAGRSVFGAIAQRVIAPPAR